jgi:hypothetical protein
MRSTLLREPTFAELNKEWEKRRNAREGLRPFISMSELKTIQNREPTSLDQILEADASKEASQQLEWE